MIIPQEDTRFRPILKFVGSVRTKEGKAFAAKDSHKCVIRCGIEQFLKWRQLAEESSR
jgi:hypothetical protein